MDRIFVDTDVIIDLLIDRKPFSDQAAIILSLSEYGNFKVYVSALTFANCYYILRKFSSHQKVISKLVQLSQIVEIMNVTKESILYSLHSSFKDFEDSIQHETAKSDTQIKLLITRNIKDYRKSNLSILSPEDYLKSL
ncbi:MAG: PIN domain-containing protein [Saprospiraceae bacterium]|nr:PIN domain-containing protein [Saprospiraceae bacterium]